MKTHKLWAWMFLFATLAFVLQFSTAARAQDNDNDDDRDDPPGRVARLNYSQGSVSFRPAGEDDWVTAVPNRPVVTGDDLWADDNSRAELHAGSTAIRLDSRTGITFLNLDDDNTQIRVAEGSLIVRVRHMDDDDTFEIDTPNVAFTLLQPGMYRVDVSQDGSRTEVTTWQGRGSVTGGGLSYTVLARQSATFTGDANHLDYDLNQVPDRDPFDKWAFDRDDREDHADSANYVSREMTGYEDLDEYGDWSYVAGYGPCWRPRAVVVGWAPYRYGHWVYVGPWGWTWVEDEPWGFAPFHYGRWASVNGGWFWVPGPVVVRPVWAPALVAFVGGGPGFHFSVGVGVGWFPLAPGEVYVPGFRVSRRYVNNVNITNTTVNITKVTNVYNTVIINKNTTINNITYVNQRVNNGVTVVSHETFVNARPVHNNIMRVDTREVVSAPITRAVAVEPVRTSVVGAGRPVSVRPPAAIISRPVVAVRTPPVPVRSIEQRQTQAGGRLNQDVLVRPVGPARPLNPVNQRATQPSQEGSHNVGQLPNAGDARDDNRAKPTLRPQPRVFDPPTSPRERTDDTPDNRTARPMENQNAQPNRPSQPENREVHSPQREPMRQTNPPETHPLVRPTPPVQQRTPQQEQQQEQKFNQWHEQRQATPPAQPRQQQQSRPEPKQDSKPPKKDR